MLTTRRDAGIGLMFCNQSQTVISEVLGVMSTLDVMAACQQPSPNTCELSLDVHLVPE